MFWSGLFILFLLAEKSSMSPLILFEYWSIVLAALALYASNLQQLNNVKLGMSLSTPDLTDLNSSGLTSSIPGTLAQSLPGL